MHRFPTTGVVTRHAHPSGSLNPEHLPTPPQTATCTVHSHASEVPPGLLGPHLLAANAPPVAPIAAEPSRTPHHATKPHFFS